MTVYNNLHDGSDDGMQIGIDSTQKLGFFGATPIVRPTTGTAVTATVATTAATTGTAIGYGFTGTTQFNNLIAAVNSLITAVSTIKTNLDNLGIQA